jgi:uncharacterized protein (DUF305 family)
MGLRGGSRAIGGSLAAGCAAVLAIGTTGCVGTASSARPATTTQSTADRGSTAGAAFNGTDVMFAQMMVPHHEQGRRIAALAKTHQIRPQMAMLAAAIESTQATEVQTMAGWLRTWGQPPSADPGAHAAHGGMPGTSDAEIGTVDRATGADFERRWLNMLIAHQDDAVQLARMETAQGVNSDARALADQIVKSRTAQIQQLLGYLGESR